MSATEVRIKSEVENITKTFDPNKFPLKNEKWNDDDEFKIVKTVRNRWYELEQARTNSCYWSSAVETVGGDIGSGSDWTTHWNQCYKLWSMWKAYVRGRSNLKSPTSFAPVEAAVSEFVENIPTVNLRTENPEDEDNIKVFNAWIQAWESTENVEQAKINSIQDCGIVGTQIFHNCYVRREREVEYLLTPEETKERVKAAKADKDGKEYKEINKTLKDKKPLTKKGTKVDYDDCAIIPISIFEFYPDSAAKCLRGLNGEAMDCIWRQTPSIEQFRAEFKNSKDPFVIKSNIDKVKSTSDTMSSYSEAQQFFKQPADIPINTDRVEVIRYYNKQTDRFEVVVNDILIRSGPLPYNHKELPFSVSKFINFPHQFYGIGIPAIVESLQAEDETLRNMALEVVKRQLAQVIMVRSDVAEDFFNQFDPLDTNMVMQISGSVGPDSIRVLEQPNSGLNGFQQLRATIHEDTIIASGINPMAMSLPKPGEPVRNNQMSMESTLKGLMKNFKNWGIGYKESIRQVVSIAKQMKPNSYIEICEDAKDDKKKKDTKPKYKNIKLKGYNLVKDEATGKLKKEKLDNPNNEVDFELKPEYFSLNSEPMVTFNVEAFAPMSNGLQMQKIEQAMRDLVPILSNPQMFAAPGISELVRQYCETHGISERVTEMLQSKSTEDQIREAEEQNSLMRQGIKIPGRPGESNEHKMTHFQELLEVTFDINEMELEYTKTSAMVPPEFDPMTGAPIPFQPEPNEKLEKLKATRELYLDHMNQDNVPKDQTFNAAASIYGQQAQMPQGPMPTQMMPQGAPPANPQLPPELAAMMGGGMPPEAMMQGLGGQGMDMQTPY